MNYGFTALNASYIDASMSKWVGRRVDDGPGVRDQVHLSARQRCLDASEGNKMIRLEESSRLRDRPTVLVWKRAETSLSYPTSLAVDRSVGRFKSQFSVERRNRWLTSCRRLG